MAAIAQTTVGTANGAVTITCTALSASDTLTYVQGSGQVLVLYNTTASPVTVTLTGSAASSISPPGYGGSISTTGGKAVVVGASQTVYLELDNISAFLPGNVTVTGGTGVTAHLVV